MRHRYLRWLPATLLAATGTAQAADIDVMTRNQYLGADLTGVILGGGAGMAAFGAAVEAALLQAAANLPEQRMVALADEIIKRRPHLVGLQEVYSYECLGGPGCSDPALEGAWVNHLDETLAALGPAYEAKALVRNLDVTLPVLLPDTSALTYIRVTDRDVILARADIAASVAPLNVAGFCTQPVIDEQGCNYEVVGTVNLLGVDVRIERGYVGVSARVEGRDYWFFDTHLEQRQFVPGPQFEWQRFIQTMQSVQLRDTIAAMQASSGPADRTIIVVGDFNSDPRDLPFVVDASQLLPPYLEFLRGATLYPPYQLFSNALLGGTYLDAWNLRPGRAPGNTCCQDEDLGNQVSVLYERVDLVFTSRTPLKVKDAQRIGEVSADRTWPPGLGLWPADHAAVAVRMQY